MEMVERIFAFATSLAYCAKSPHRERERRTFEQISPEGSISG